MKICAAQTKPVKGDIERNIDNHLQLIKLAVENGAEMIVFPELSLTGYEPELANELATTQSDSRFDVFQEISNTKHIIIGVGAPTKHTLGICISMILFQPNLARQLYSKKYLHADKEPFFISGETTVAISKAKDIALAICYELSVFAHAQNAFENGAKVYIASVAKSVSGIDKAINRLAEIAGKYSMIVLMSDCVGNSYEGLCAGKTSIWNNDGQLVAQLNDTDEGFLMVDTDTQESIKKILSVNVVTRDFA